MEQTAEIIRVLLNTPAKSGLFDYGVPPELTGQVRAGHMVIVPFNRSVHQAIVWNVNVTPEVKNILPIQEIADPVPVMTEAQMRLAEKISERFLAPLYESVNLLLTDKVRRISNPVYKLIKQDLAYQTSLVQTAEPEKDSLLALFSKNRGQLDETLLNRTFGKNGWQKGMYALTRSGAAPSGSHAVPEPSASASPSTRYWTRGAADELRSISTA